MARIQFPLAVAFAMTIHKAQGMTMDRAIIDLRRPETDAGLAYMALSRVRTLDRLAFVDGGCIIHSRLSLHSKAMELREREDDGLQALFDTQRQPVPSASNPMLAKSQPWRCRTAYKCRE